MRLAPQWLHPRGFGFPGSLVDSATLGSSGGQGAVSPGGRATPRMSIRGFTLLELTVVMLIAGILLAFSVPRLGPLTGRDLNVSCRRLSATVKYLFHRATVRRTIYRLTYDLKDNAYWVTYRNEDLEFVTDPSVLSRKVTLPREISFEDIVIVGRGRFTEGEVQTHFFPKGWVDETLVHLKDERGRQASVHILPLSARTKIYERYVEPTS